MKDDFLLLPIIHKLQYMKELYNFDHHIIIKLHNNT